MTTSGTYTFTITRDDCIRDAMQNIGKLGEAMAPTAQETIDCSRKLNMMVKQWMGKQDFAPGLKTWTRIPAELFLSGSQYLYYLGPSDVPVAGVYSNQYRWCGGTTGLSAPYLYNSDVTIAPSNVGDGIVTVGLTNPVPPNFNIGDYIGIQQLSNNGDMFWTSITGWDPVGGVITVASNNFDCQTGAQIFSYTTQGQRPLNVVTCILRDVYQNDTPMNIMTQEDYEFLPTKTQTTFVGDPTAIYYQSMLGNGQLSIDVGGAQDVTKHLHMIYMRPVQDLDNPLDNFDYPVQWANALCWGLSKQIAPMFNAPWTKEMDDNLLAAVMMAREADSETTSMYFQPKAYEY